MFDTGYDGVSVDTHDSGDDRLPIRRQYTLKGVEADAIRLMRHAANKEGMKIGSWVSLRMREAAERALSSPVTVDDHTRNRQPEQHIAGSFAVNDLIKILRDHQESTERRLLILERELHEITSGQRSILSALLSDRLTK